MKRLFCLLFLLLLPTGCGTKPAPAWIAAGHKQLETFKQDFLTGRAPRITESHFRNAVEEIKKGGDTDLMGKAWLTRMALQIAVLREPEEGDYLKIEAADAVPANRNFYLFLKGSAAAVDVLLLPESYRPFWATLRSGDAAKAAVAITAIDDPLSRLIASGLAVRHGLETEAILRTAVETASRNGWKMALLSWLERLKCFHEAAGDTEKASAIRSRIDLIL
ncbi:MAG: hypothetical protein JXL20_02670 [Deltaproteobacteria bacterium]|nr:hypothetical protein [Deltaproteobacteria bacterium]